MPCYHPLKAWRGRQVNPSTGKRGIVFNRAHGFFDLPLQLPCGQCIGCRLERSRQWAIRCLHEASLYEKNCFITLTYDDENIPADYSLDIRDFQLFMKRLRKKYGSGIRFYHCGEYGENTSRPHYHACIFNHDFDDKIIWKETNENPIYISESLTNLWGKGFSTLGDVTFNSAAYVARYIMKKITGPNSAAHYTYMDELNNVYSRTPEYTTMSRRPGIAQGWYEKWKTDVFPSDEIIINGHPVKPPKYYDVQLEKASQKEAKKIKILRKKNAKKHKADQTPERLRVRETVKMASISRLPRKEI